MHCVSDIATNRQEQGVKEAFIASIDKLHQAIEMCCDSAGRNEFNSCSHEFQFRGWKMSFWSSLTGGGNPVGLRLKKDDTAISVSLPPWFGKDEVNCFINGHCLINTNVDDRRDLRPAGDAEMAAMTEKFAEIADLLHEWNQVEGAKLISARAQAQRDASERQEAARSGALSTFKGISFS